ncbi:MAG: hypothetical protein ACK5Y2_04170 [Bdellovibrionales bacterium]
MMKFWLLTLVLLNAAKASAVPVIDCVMDDLATSDRLGEIRFELRSPGVQVQKIKYLFIEGTVEVSFHDGVAGLRLSSSLSDQSSFMSSPVSEWTSKPREIARHSEELPGAGDTIFTRCWGQRLP